MGSKIKRKMIVLCSQMPLGILNHKWAYNLVTHNCGESLIDVDTQKSAAPNAVDIHGRRLCGSAVPASI